MNREPMKHLSFKLGDLPIMKNNGDTYELELCHKAVASVMKDVEKADDKVIYEAMIEFASVPKGTPPIFHKELQI